MVTAMGKINQTIKRKEEENKSKIKDIKKEYKKLDARLKEHETELSKLELKM